MNLKTSAGIGRKRRKLRTEAHLSQKELAEGIVTRNMLSMIESERVFPSVETVLQLCSRLKISPGYLFADSKEELMYRKYAVIERMRVLFDEKRYGEVIGLSEGLEEDDEIAFLCAFSHLNLGMILFSSSPAEAFSLHFRCACDLSEKRQFGQYINNTVETAHIIRDNAGVRNASVLLRDIRKYGDCAFPKEFYVYLTALKFIENGDFASAGVICESGLLFSDCYRLHIEGSLLDAQGESEKAISVLLHAAESVQNGFYSTLRIYTDIELCAQKLGDYKLAFEYSTRHIRLIENVKK